MADQQHPITPSPELVEEWNNEAAEMYGPDYRDHIATCAAQWGADQELEACCEWLQDPDLNVDTYKLRTARRPKPPSSAEEELSHFESYAATFETSGGDSDLVRRALERLQELEGGQ